MAGTWAFDFDFEDLGIELFGLVLGFDGGWIF